MKHKHNAGFSLIEVLVAMAVLGVIVLPICSSLVLSFRMNAKTDAMLQAQLAVSSAVETLMAEGIPAGTETTPAEGDYGKDDTTDRFPDVIVQVKKENISDTYYHVTVTDNDELVTVTTYIREKEGGSP